MQAVVKLHGSLVCSSKVVGVHSGVERLPTFMHVVRPWTVNAEIYPLHLRASCISISTSVNWLMTFVVSVTFLQLAAALSTDAPRLRELEDGSYALTISAPGVSANDLKVSIEDGVLKVDGESNMASKIYVTHWTTRLPNDVDVDKASVTSTDGIITVAFPKKAPAEPTVIEVNASMDEADVATTGDEDAPKAYTLSISAPGIASSELLVVADNESIKVRGQSARTGHRVARSLRLPRDADAAGATASHIDGLLTLSIPLKSAAASAARTLVVNEEEHPVDDAFQMI